MSQANFLPEKPATDAGRRALELYAAAQEATRGVEVARDTCNRLTANLRCAEAEFEKLVRSNSASGMQDIEGETAASDKVQSALRLASQGALEFRINTARKVAEQAANALQQHCRANWEELIGEHAEEAHAAAEDLAEGLAAIRPLEERRNAVAQRVSALCQLAMPSTAPGQVQDFSGWMVPQSPAVPLPPCFTDPEPVEPVEAPEPVKSEPAVIVGRA